MPAIHVRDVPESIAGALKERAKRHGQSMQRELREILASAAAAPPEERDIEPIVLRTVHAGSTTTWPREEMYDDSAR